MPGLLSRRSLGLASFVARRLAECDEEEDPNYLLGFGLTFVAGMATVLGCLAILCVRGKKNPKRVTAGALAFAAGVMMYVSFIDVLGGEAPEFFLNHFRPEECGAENIIENATSATENVIENVIENATSAIRRLAAEEEEEEPIWVRICVAGFFFLGIVMATGLDKCVDVIFSDEHGHSHGEEAVDSSSDEGSEAEAGGEGKKEEAHGQGSSLERIGFVTFLALSMHNFPEGLATFFGGGSGSYTIPIAIAMHNIPEGMAIAVPTYQATGSAPKAILNTFIAGLAQPVGAGVGWLLIAIFGMADLPAFLYGVVYSVTAGIMVCVSLMELLPEAFAAASPVFVIYWVLAGFILMEISIICLDLSGA